MLLQLGRNVSRENACYEFAKRLKVVRTKFNQLVLVEFCSIFESYSQVVNPIRKFAADVVLLQQIVNLGKLSAE